MTQRIIKEPPPRTRMIKGGGGGVGVFLPITILMMILALAAVLP